MDWVVGLLFVSAVGNIVNVVGGVFWNAKIREAKDERIKGLQEQLDGERERSAPKLEEIQKAQVRMFTDQVERLEEELKQLKEESQLADESSQGKIKGLEAGIASAQDALSAAQILASEVWITEETWAGQPYDVINLPSGGGHVLNFYTRSDYDSTWREYLAEQQRATDQKKNSEGESS